MIERWLPVVGYEGRYEVSDLGRLKSLPNARRKTTIIMKLTPAKRGGYPCTSLTDKHNGKHRQRLKKLHRLVLEAFEGQAPVDKPFGCHKDGDTSNNRLANLYWGSEQENSDDRERHGRANKGEKNGQSVLTESDVRLVKSLIPALRKRGDLVKISRETGIHYSAVRHIAQGYSWDHV